MTGRAVQRHRVALLALLVLSPGRCATRDKLMGYLWPEHDRERARQLLNQAVYQLRKALGEDAILSVADELRLNTDVVETDVLQFEAALASGDHATAVALYAGPLLDGVFLSDALEYERWMERERDRLAGAQAGALEALAEAAEQAGDQSKAVEWWKARAALDPYDSRVALRLMRALHAAGNRAGALQHAGVHARLLESEFGIAPAAEVAEYTEQLRAEPAADAGVSVAAPTVTAASPPAAAPVVAGDDVAAERHPPIQPATPRRTSRTRRIAYASVAGATLLSAAALWFWGPGADQRWLRDSAMPKIERALAVADWESAFALAKEAEQRTPGSRDVAELWPRLSWHVKLESEPAGATVFRQAYDASDDEWEELGRTPLPDVRIPYGLSRLRFELPGYRPLVRALGGAHLNWRELQPMDPDMLLVGPEVYRLDTAETLPADMVRVPGFRLYLEGEAIQLQDFFLGRYEVTNEAYRVFVEAGGYRRQELWDPIVVRGDTLPFAAAMARFVDRTGRPGPSTWQAGDYPAGEASFPVSGVSWYEAAAYARFVGRELPTASHWQQALANAMFPWLLRASNFSGRGVRPGSESRAMSHVEAFDLAGNVREWTSSTIGNDRIILGGSFNDPYYIAGTTDTSAPPEDRSDGNGIRLALTMDPPDVAARVRAAIPKRNTASVVATQPVSDETYAAFSRFFDYDRGPLLPTVEAVDSSRLWIHERVRLDAGYRGERMLLNLYLPTSAARPLQTVVYWPGWDTFWLDDADEYFTKQVDFIVKSGRAVAFPMFRGTFERRVGGATRRAEFGTAEYRDNTIETVKELRRTIDYLETRPDLDSSAIALFGYSWGGVNGPTALAQEPRLRVGVIYIGLLPPMAATPEVDPANALPRVHVPVLLFSGEFDPMVPRENADRYFALIGVPVSQKRHVVAIGGHFIPRDLLIRETLEWLDRHLGPTGR